MNIQKILIVKNLRLSNETVKRNVKIAVALSNLMHETQKERGATAGYLGSKGKIFIKKNIFTFFAIINNRYKCKSFKITS